LEVDVPLPSGIGTPFIDENWRTMGLKTFGKKNNIKKQPVGLVM